MALTIRLARRVDVPALVDLLIDDPLGRNRESVKPDDLSLYFKAFEAINEDPNNEMLVAEGHGAIVAMAQLTYTPGLSRLGAWRATIESVRVHRDRRNQGIGRRLMRAAIARAEARNCRLVQLTTDHGRPEARAFYETLGFRHTHAGMKLELRSSRVTALSDQATTLNAAAAKQRIRAAVRMVCFHRDALLAQRHVGDPHTSYAFPGGALELGETMADRVREELTQEWGRTASKAEYLFVVENRFPVATGLFHAVEHYFLIELDSYDVRSKEPHLSAHWIPLRDLTRFDLRPTVVRDAIADGSWRHCRHFVVPFREHLSLQGTESRHDSRDASPTISS